ncbi:MAG TPA: glycosyltransferase 87 family protein [Candidatus Dormibacteraeota bacterium]|nr:glycosyltransferase 87 family protein [Candidatus Dormibacteraeota bacterium]
MLRGEDVRLQPAGLDREEAVESSEVRELTSRVGGSGTRVQGLRDRIVTRVSLWRPEAGDAVLYAGSALFAEFTARFSSISLYRQWGELALGPYLLAALISALSARAHRNRAGAERDARLAGEPVPPRTPGATAGTRQWGPVRIWVFVFALVGATVLPLSLEVAWRAQGNPTAHVQPEAVVVEQAAHRAANGHDPYRLITSHGRVVVPTPPGQPTSESFFPYLPLMTLFGLPSSTKEPIALTDSRIFFSMVTMLVVVGALVMSRGPNEPKVRTLQVLTVLPTAALPLATGGDDMPVVAFLLLAMVLAQRRRPGWSGFVLGVASSMKFTAWPLAALALFAARDAQGRRAPGRMALGMLVVAGPVVAPFVLRNPQAFVENVILFPLGLSGVSSPAASALPGHVLVGIFPSLHRILPVAVGVVGSSVLVARLLRRTPSTAAQVTALAGWVMLVAFLLAPATRVGYLLYPLNFFVWSHLLREPEREPEPERSLLAAVAVPVTSSA